MVAPGTLLRDGLDRILRAKRGALVIVGDGHEVLSICSGGFLLDAEFSPQRLSELAKMDGAIILAKDSSRIARANVHLMPDPSIPTTETGTRHRTAERVARSIDVPVLSVSAAMSIIAVYRNDYKHIVQPTGWLHDRADQALATMQRFRNRFDVAVNGLSILEVEDSVSVGDVVGVVQAGRDGSADRRRGRRLPGRARGGRSLGRPPAQPSWSTVWPRLSTSSCGTTAPASRHPSRTFHHRTRMVLRAERHPPCHARRAPIDSPCVNKLVDELSELPSDELSDPKRVAEVLRLPGTFDDAHSGIEPRGYRLLYRLPRFSDAIIERIVDRFHNLQQIMRASLSELEKVEGVGEAHARFGQERSRPAGRGQHFRALPVSPSASDRTRKRPCDVWIDGTDRSAPLDSVYH